MVNYCFNSLCKCSGETANSIQPPEQSCGSQDPDKLCNEKTCFTCNSRREANSQTVRGTLLVSFYLEFITMNSRRLFSFYIPLSLSLAKLQIPCRTAMRGSFPLNGTYFQVNEVSRLVSCPTLSSCSICLQN